MRGEKAKRRIGLFLALPALLGGCAHVVSPQLRALAREDLTFPMVLSDPERYQGEVVIWGGVIIETQNRPEGTTLVILETPLDREGAPKDAEFSRGRFLARTRSFLDQAVYREGRKVTVAGEVAGKEVRAVGEMQYSYPVLAAREIHLWREPPVAWGSRYPLGPYWYWWDPYWPWWPGWGFYWRRH